MVGTRIICGDIGGTNARLELWASPSEPSSALAATDFKLELQKIYPSAEFSGLAPLVVQFLNDAAVAAGRGDGDGDGGGGDGDGPIVVHACCMAVCGPVKDEDYMCGPVLPEQPPTQWDAKKADLTTGVLAGKIREACLVNDFIAVGLGLTALDKKDVVTLHEAAPPEHRAPIACVGAGTGLGEVFLTWQAAPEHPDGGYYAAYPSEGGMTEFLPRTDDEWGLRRWLFDRDGYTTVEGVVSGPGIANTYNYLQATRGGLTAAELTAAAAAAKGGGAAGGGGSSKGAGQLAGEQQQEQQEDDDAPAIQKVVVERALAATDADPLCRAALDMVLEAWAAECRSVALRVMPYGGLYLAGGLTPKLLSRIKTVLTAAYTQGDPLMKDVIQTFPLYACLDEHVGLLGARVRAIRML